MRTIQLGSRRYFAHVPRKLGKSPALVVALHAGAQTPEGFARMTGWNDVVGRDAVVVYPEGIGRSWNAGNGALGEAGRKGVDDVGFVDAAIRDASARWKCGRVYLSGFSNGSMLAHLYTATFPGVVWAAGCVSGGFSRLPTHGLGLGYMPHVRVVHGRTDDHVPFAGGVGTAHIPGGEYNHLPIEMTAGWWRGQGAEITTVWHSGGHEWPGGETRAQWEFFRGIGP